jgi:hypothetical protein
MGFSVLQVFFLNILCGELMGLDAEKHLDKRT